MTEELGSIGVKLRVDLSDLDRAETQAKKRIAGIAREHTISFKVGSVNTAEVQKQIRAIAAGKLDVKIGVSLPANAGRQLHAQLQSQLKAAGPVKVNVTADLSTAELNKIKTAIGKAGIKLTGGGGAAGGASGPSPSAPLTPHERKVVAETAAGIAKVVKGSPAKPSAAASVERFDPAYKVPAGAAAALQRRAAEDLAKAAKAIETATKAPRAKAAPPPSRGPGLDRPLADFGGLPTGPAVGLSIAPDPATGRRRVVPEPTKGVLKRLSRSGQRVSSQGMSLNTLKQEKARPAQVDPGDEEYASRPTAVHLPLDEQGIYEMERSGRGVRGAGRSGARQRNEPVLTAAERQAIGDKQDIMADEESANADKRVRDPARRSGAYYGSRASHPGYARRVEGLQFVKFDPALGAAQKALEAGDLDGARAALRGFSGQLAGADPRQRKKFFRLFRNVENAPPEVLEKHAALQALFAEIGIQEAKKRVDTTEATLAPYRKGKGAKELREKAPDAYQDAVEAAKAARKFEQDMLRGLRPRAGGGRVQGDLADTVFEHVAQKRRHKLTEAIDYDMPHLTPQEKAFRRHEISKLMGRQKTHEIDGGELDREIQRNQLMSGFPYHDLFSPENAVGDVAHNPFGGSIHQMFGETRPFIPKRAGGGPVGGGLMARLAAAKAKKEAYLVGETKPELFIGNSGRAEIVGQHGPEIRTFPESGKIEPHVPEWIRRGIAKDLTGRAPGGPVRGFGGRAFRSYVEGEKEAIGSGVLTRAGSESVQRVFVVNFPSGGGANQRGGSVAAGPLRFSSDKEAKAFADTLGGHIGSQLQNILGNTVPVQAQATPAAAGGAALTASERQAIGAQARGQTSGLEGRISSARAATAEAQQLIPVRSLSVAVGQIFSTIFGGRGDAITRAKQANELAAKATSATGRFRGEESKLLEITGKLNKEQDPAKQKGLVDQRREQAKATRAAFLEAKDLTEQSEKASQAIIGQAGAIQNLAAGTLGVVTGTLLFSTALGAAQAGISAVTQVLGPAVERMTGFDQTAAQVSGTLADQTRQSGGAVKQTVALTAAQAGLSSATAQTISPILEQRASTEAGNKALTDSLALLHTFENTQQRGGGQAGLTQTQGGLFGTILGGVPSTSEQVGNELANVPTAADAVNVQRNKAAQAGILKSAGVSDASNLTGRFKQAYEALGTVSTDLDTSSDRIKFFNDAIAKGGEQFKFVAQRDMPSLDANVKELSAKAADAAGAFDIAANIRAGKTILTGPSGAPVTNAQDVTKALGAINTGLTTPDPALLIKQLTDRVIPAQLASFRAQGNLSRNLINPAQFALGEIAAPTPGLKGGPSFETGLVGKGDQQAAKTAAAIKGQIGGAISYVNAQIDKGRDALVNLVPPDLQTEFKGILSDITATGQQISKIQSGVQQQQVNLEVADYNNQLRIAKRSLQDAKDLQAGIAGATKETAGGLEGQNVALQRQLQLLQFELQQRQINFSVAAAGFVAPGTTPEERAARIDEAKAEAAFAQKQLDIQKQLAGNQFKGIQITTSRDVTDLVKQIGLLQQGREVTISTAAASKALDILNKKQSLLTEQAGTYIEEGVKITQAALDAASQVQQQTGKGFASILSQTASAWGIFGNQAKVILDGLTGTAPGGGTRTVANTDNSKKGIYASGIVGDTLGPTEITVGEAAGEKVAVLKNPKLVPSSSFASGANGGSTGGGAMVQMTVVISGNSVREDSDLEALAERVAKKVEDRLMQKTSLFGLRRA